MSSWSEDVAIEIEALQATYGTDLILNEPQQQVSMLVLPHQDAVQQQQQQHYVQCLLSFTLPAEYPSQAPAIHIQDAKGFINRHDQLQQQLTADAVDLAGELLLGHLFEAAKVWLNDNDVPEGEQRVPQLCFIAMTPKYCCFYAFASTLLLFLQSTFPCMANITPDWQHCCWQHCCSASVHR